MIAVIDYRAGNLTSVKMALNKLGIAAKITSNKDEILAADRVIFPGVGAAGSAMQNLRDMNLIDVVPEVFASGKPLLGICVGMQIMLESSDENGGVPCLGIIQGKCEKFHFAGAANLKIPEIGWNQVQYNKKHPVLNNIETGTDFYFVHSYYPNVAEDANIASTTHGDCTFTSILGRDNMLATQFHPEKSGRFGLQLLKNFSTWDGKTNA